jgi:very-short-patch-repair endonuclease
MKGHWCFFIADFFCYEHRLVVEIDGGIHEKQKDYDELRTHIIKDLGYQVIRFTNYDVTNNSEFVLSELEKVLNINLHTPLSNEL